MKPKFEIVFLEPAIDFMDSLSLKARKKIYYNLSKSSYTNDPRLFKKLTSEIWEFRTLYEGVQYRLLAFWDRKGRKDALVIATHGFKKKVGKVPKQEIERALKIRAKYYN